MNSLSINKPIIRYFRYFFYRMMKAALRMDKVQHTKEMTPERLENEHRVDDPNIFWTQSGPEKVPVVRFDAKASVSGDVAKRAVGQKHNLQFKLGRISSPLIRDILVAHGFQEVQGNREDVNLIWRGSCQDPAVYENLASFQKINHFPKSHQLGRKDLLCKNIKALEQKFKSHEFDFLPESYVLPEEYEAFNRAFRQNESNLWIIKPVASSCGNGIKVIDSMTQVSERDRAVVSRYVSDPLLIDGYKFDLRIYVLVTSYSPLVIYLYEEGLTRLATEKYNPTEQSLKNKFMHLTNTSVNKKSWKYKKGRDQETEDRGNLWSLSALLRYLKERGKDTAALMRQIEDVVIKTLISAEKSQVGTPDFFPFHARNCFELYGFDILVDESLKPWLLEVNTSPALTYSGPMDLKIKTHLLADTLTLVGVECRDPNEKAEKPSETTKQDQPTYVTIGEENKKIRQRIKEEDERKGGFVRIFPKRETWQTYCPLLYRKNLNELLYGRLFAQGEDDLKEERADRHIQQYARKLPPLRKDSAGEPGRQTSPPRKTLPPLRKIGSGEHKQQVRLIRESLLDVPKWLEPSLSMQKGQLELKPTPPPRDGNRPQTVLASRRLVLARTPPKPPVNTVTMKNKSQYDGKLPPITYDSVKELKAQLEQRARDLRGRKIDPGLVVKKR